MGLFNSKPKLTKYDSYIADHFDILAYTCDDDSAVCKSVLGRLRNALAVALNENDKLPKYILLVLETDLMQCVNFNKPGLTEIYGRVLHWLLDDYHNAIAARKQIRPVNSCIRSYL